MMTCDHCRIAGLSSLLMRAAIDDDRRLIHSIGSLSSVHPSRPRNHLLGSSKSLVLHMLTRSRGAAALQYY
jgi:hypothetical protein